MVEESEEINTKSRNYNKIKTSRSGGEQQRGTGDQSTKNYKHFLLMADNKKTSKEDSYFSQVFPERQQNGTDLGHQELGEKNMKGISSLNQFHK